MSTESSNLNARHLLICRDVIHDPDSPGASYSLFGLTVSIRPIDDFGFPLIAERLWLFVQFFGDPGEYDVALELFIIDPATDAEKRIESYGPFRVVMEVGRFVQGIPLILGLVRFPDPGLYEFRLQQSGSEEIIIAERILLEA